MRDIDYGYIHLKLKEVMKEQHISINKLACRAITAKSIRCTSLFI